MGKGMRKLLKWFSSEKDYGEKVDIPENEYQDNLDIFLKLALKDRIFSIYSIIMIILIMCSIIDFVIYHTMMFFQTYGLLLDITGAFVLARGLFRGESEFLFDIQERNFGEVIEVEKQEYSSESITVEMLNTADGIWGSTISNTRVFITNNKFNSK